MQVIIDPAEIERIRLAREAARLSLQPAESRVANKKRRKQAKRALAQEQRGAPGLPANPPLEAQTEAQTPQGQSQAGAHEGSPEAPPLAAGAVREACSSEPAREATVPGVASLPGAASSEQRAQGPADVAGAAAGGSCDQGPAGRGVADSDGDDEDDEEDEDDDEEDNDDAERGEGDEDGGDREEEGMAAEDGEVGRASTNGIVPRAGNRGVLSGVEVAAFSRASRRGDKQEEQSDEGQEHTRSSQPRRAPTIVDRARSLIILDASNICMCHGRNKLFSTKGLQLTLDYYRSHGHRVIAFMPEFYLDYEYVGNKRRVQKVCGSI